MLPLFRRLKKSLTLIFPIDFSHLLTHGNPVTGIGKFTGRDLKLLKVLSGASISKKGLFPGTFKRKVPREHICRWGGPKK